MNNFEHLILFPIFLELKLSSQTNKRKRIKRNTYSYIEYLKKKKKKNTLQKKKKEKR